MCTAIVEATSAAGSVSLAASSPKVIAAVSSAAMTPSTGMPNVHINLELNWLWEYRFLLSHVDTAMLTESFTTKLVSVRRKICPKCGTVRKTTKLSCCARGGAWFRQCGDAGDTNFEHTWIEGIQACGGSALVFERVQSSILVEAPAQVRHERMITQSINVTNISQDTEQDTNVHPTSSRLTANKDYEERAELSTVITLTACGLLLVNLPSQI